MILHPSTFPIHGLHAQRISAFIPVVITTFHPILNSPNSSRSSQHYMYNPSHHHHHQQARFNSSQNLPSQHAGPPRSQQYRHESGTRHRRLQNSPKSPFVPSSTSCSSLTPYFFLYASLTFAKCLGSQWKRTRRLTSKSVRSLEVSARAWCRRRASRTGRLRTPLIM